jgi:hypothetical protein
MEYDTYKLATPPYCNKENDQVITRDITVKGDIEQMKQFEKFLEEFSEETGIEIEY